MKKSALLLLLLTPVMLLANEADALLKEAVSLDPAFAAAKPDLKKAFLLYKKAAEKGSAAAMYRVYLAYSTQPDNPDNPTAQNKYGVVADEAEAFVWISLACDYGTDSAMDVYREARAAAAWGIRYHDLKKTNAPIPKDNNYETEAVKKYKARKSQLNIPRGR